MKCIQGECEMWEQSLGMNSTYQNMRTRSYKYASANTFCPSYRSANLVTISTDITNFAGSYLSHRIAKPAVGLHLTFTHTITVIISITG
jgi:hypothetical protein